MEILGPDGKVIGGPSRVEELERNLQEAISDRRVLEREAELMAWHVLNATGPASGDMETKDRLKLAKASREVWQRDPQAGAAIDLLNDFVFGRGVPRPRAKDEEVQKILDEAWDDPDNQLVLTSYDKLLEKGADLQIQANVFFLLFEGDDGKVKLGLLEHDTVEDVVRDPDNRLRILYYKTTQKSYEWDYDKDQLKADHERRAQPKVVYYEHWRNVDDAIDAGGLPQAPPPHKLGEGRVYHVAINKTSEMAFGVPPMRRLMRWFSAYNEFMTSRVDVVKAAAAFIMKRKIRGGEAAVQRIAAQHLNRSSELAAEDRTTAPPPPGSILNENDGVVHEALNLQTGAGNALQDGQMIRSQISAATRFPQHYLGDAGSANLATATAMELPVLKAVEARQEVWEGVFRMLADRAIDRAIESGRLTREAEAEELVLGEGHEDQVAQEEETERDLSYEFSLPSPLRRMISELVNSIANIAKTFDPNGTNVELSRLLLNVALGEGLEIEDPASAVEVIFPEGYVDPMMQAMQDQQAAAQRGEPGQQPGQENPFGPPSASSSNTPAYGGDASGNPYGANRGARSRTPEEVREAELQEARYIDLPDGTKRRVKTRAEALEELWSVDIAGVLAQELARVNGNGKGG